MNYISKRYYVTEEKMRKVQLSDNLQDYVHQALEEYYEEEDDFDSVLDMVDTIFIGYCYTSDKELKNKLSQQQKIFLINDETIKHIIVEIVDEYMDEYGTEKVITQTDYEYGGSYYEQD